jgi:Ca2+-binding RTX toxin-like protein
MTANPGAALEISASAKEYVAKILKPDDHGPGYDEASEGITIAPLRTPNGFSPQDFASSDDPSGGGSAQSSAPGITVTGTSDSEFLPGTDGADTIAGGAGTDILYGGLGSDTYVYLKDDGFDSIIDFAGAGDVDTLQLADLNPDDVTVTGDGADLMIHNRSRAAIDNGEAYTTLFVAGQFEGDGSGVEQIQFADGTIWDRDTIASHAIHAPTGADVFGGSIEENAAAGAFVAQLAGIDPDFDSRFTYSLVDDPSGLFAVTTSGRLNVGNGAAIDFEGATSLDVTVRVADQTGLSFDKTLTVTVENVVGQTITGTDANDTLIGTIEEDVLIGLGGNDNLNGGTGADKFVFDAVALSDAQSAIIDIVKDYNQGNGNYQPGEGDQIDLSALLSTAYNHGSGQAVASLVRAVEDAGGTFAKLQVDADGTANGVNWTTIARLDGLHTGNNLSIILDSSLPGGSTIAISAPSALAKTSDFNGDNFGDILFRNNSTGDTGYTDIHNNVFHNLGGSPVAWSVVGAGDYNGDSFSDILFRNNATGDTGYTDIHNNVFHSLGGSPVAWAVVGSGDYNGDTFSDILFRDNATGDTGYTDLHNNVFHSLGGSPTAYSVVGSGDYNGDGFSDILFRNNSTGDTGYTDLHNNVFHSLGGSPVAYSVVGSGDYNGDGFSDILFRNNSTGDTGYTDIHNNVFHSLGGSPASYSVVGSGDYNGDSFSDILFRNNSTGDTGYTDLHNNVFHSLGGSPAAYLVMA